MIIIEILINPEFWFVPKFNMYIYIHTYTHASLVKMECHTAAL